MSIDKNVANDGESIKKHLAIVLKESMKFALVTVTLFLTVGMTIAYALLYIVGMNVGTAGTLTGIIIAILVLAVDCKWLHTHDKIVENNMRISKKISQRLLR